MDNYEYTTHQYEFIKINKLFDDIINYTDGLNTRHKKLNKIDSILSNDEYNNKNKLLHLRETLRYLQKTKKLTLDVKFTKQNIIRSNAILQVMNKINGLNISVCLNKVPNYLDFNFNLNFSFVDCKSIKYLFHYSYISSSKKLFENIFPNNLMVNINNMITKISIETNIRVTLKININYIVDSIIYLHLNANIFNKIYLPNSIKYIKIEYVTMKLIILPYNIKYADINCSIIIKKSNQNLKILSTGQFFKIKNETPLKQIKLDSYHVNINNTANIIKNIKCEALCINYYDLVNNTDLYLIDDKIKYVSINKIYHSYSNTIINCKIKFPNNLQCLTVCDNINKKININFDNFPQNINYLKITNCNITNKYNNVNILNKNNNLLYLGGKECDKNILSNEHNKKKLQQLFDNLYLNYNLN
jgi:hypothetical protein